MNRYAFAIFLAAVMASAVPAHAQTASQANVAAACGTQTYPVGSVRPQIQTTAGNTCGDLSGGAGPSPIASSETNLSSTVVGANAFQQIAAANTSRKAFFFQNICPVAAAGACVATGDNCYVYFGTNGTATKARSRLLLPGQVIWLVSGVIPSDAVQITCDGTGDSFASSVQ